MNKTIRKEILQAIKIHPNLIESFSKEYYLDLDFYRVAISLNINVYFFLPVEYQQDKIIIDTIIQNSSTNYLKFPYSALKIHDKKQKLELLKINSIICFINFYKIIYGVDREFESEIFFKYIADNDKIYNDINEPLKCLNELERNYIIYRYGLVDGKVKSLECVMNYYHFDYNKICELESNSITKLRQFVKENGCKLKKI